MSNLFANMVGISANATQEEDQPFAMRKKNSKNAFSGFGNLAVIPDFNSK